MKNITTQIRSAWRSIIFLSITSTAISFGAAHAQQVLQLVPGKPHSETMATTALNTKLGESLRIENLKIHKKFLQRRLVAHGALILLSTVTTSYIRNLGLNRQPLTILPICSPISAADTKPKLPPDLILADYRTHHFCRPLEYNFIHQRHAE